MNIIVIDHVAVSSWGMSLRRGMFSVSNLKV